MFLGKGRTQPRPPAPPFFRAIFPKKKKLAARAHFRIGAKNKKGAAPPLKTLKTPPKRPKNGHKKGAAPYFRPSEKNEKKNLPHPFWTHVKKKEKTPRTHFVSFQKT